MLSYQQNLVIIQQAQQCQQPQQQQPQQATHSQMYFQEQMPFGPYVNNQMLGNPAE